MRELKLIGKNIARLRKKRGMTQEDLCGIVEMDRSYLSQIENGKINMTISTLATLARVLKVELSTIVSKSD